MVDADHIIVGNDNNLPFCAGRHLTRADDNELILLRVPGLLRLDAPAAADRLMRFLAVDGVTGQEAAIAAAIVDALKEAGVPASAIRFDDAHKRIPLPTETGNLIVDLPGTRPGPRLLFSTHLDTVPLCAGAKPRREGDRIVTDGTTALGGDNRTGCARAGHAGRDADQAQAAASADHAAVHGARGKRPARRARARRRRTSAAR